MASELGGESSEALCVGHRGLSRSVWVRVPGLQFLHFPVSGTHLWPFGLRALL